MTRRLLAWALLASVTAVCGCSSLGGSAIGTGPLRLPPRSGPVALYATNVPTDASEIGVVEVHGSNDDGAIDVLMPLFANKVASLGANGGVVDSVSARVDYVPRPIAISYTYPCGYARVCIGTRWGFTEDQVLVVVVRGRAIWVGPKPATGSGT